MKKILFLISLFPFQAFAVATPVTPVISTTVGCPAGANNGTTYAVYNNQGSTVNFLATITRIY